MRLLHKTSASKSNLMEYIVEYLSMKVNRLELNYIKLHKELKAVTQKPVFKQYDFTRPSVQTQCPGYPGHWVE